MLCQAKCSINMHENYYVSNYDNLFLIEIPIMEGMAIKGVYDQVGGYAQEEYTWSRYCDYLGAMIAMETEMIMAL